jgi:transposase
MPAPVDVRQDYTPGQLRDIAATLTDIQHGRRLRAIAAVLEGKSRTQAASIGGMERQTLRDWVHRFNTEGPDGLKNVRPPGRPPKLGSEQLAAIEALVSDPQAHGLRRWRLADLALVIRERFGVEHDEVSVGRVMKRLGYSYNGVDWLRTDDGVKLGRECAERCDARATPTVRHRELETACDR